jgi:aspartyl-tRNA(Asn)/glutamyl-tRNA(Gln) amidotransferase subunit B
VPSAEWEVVVGLEVHAQLLTRTKAFCPCEVRFGEPPNTRTCPVCLGLPGALPVLNAEAVRMAVAAALALGCDVQETSVFARKNYFYPDLPKGYQISQYDRPLALRGSLEIDHSDSAAAGLDRGAPCKVGITRVHMEEDAGKNVHARGDRSIVDLNRAGTPLIEIVGEPDLRSGAEAADYLKRLREILVFLGVNDGNLEQGSFRCDANVSVRPRGEAKLGTRTELKNINSFKFVAEAIEIEARRQIVILERGDRVRQQTRGYHADKRETFLMRDKENEAGYRYFPEPDLPPLVLDAAFVAAVKAGLPETPVELRRRFVDGFGVTPLAAVVLTSHPKIAAFFEQAARLHGNAVQVANFVQAEVLRDVTVSGLDAKLPITAARLADLLALVDAGKISGKQAKEVFGAISGTDLAPADVVQKRGMTVIGDVNAIEALAREIVAANAKQAAAYRAGKTTLLGFFVGQIMKATGGSADPKAVNDALARVLGDAPASGDRPTPLAVAPPAGSKAAKPSIALPPPPPPRPAKEPSVAPPPPPSALPPASAMPLSGAPDSLSSTEPKPLAVPFEAFSKLDIRVGVIVAAARVPRKDKLLDLSIDVGEAEPRRVVSGLALSFAPESLVGRRVLVLCNLEARAFSKDLVSRGMLLAAGPSDALSLATVTGEPAPGTPIK